MMYSKKSEKVEAILPIEKAPFTTLLEVVQTYTPRDSKSGRTCFLLPTVNETLIVWFTNAHNADAIEYDYLITDEKTYDVRVWKTDETITLSNKASEVAEFLRRFQEESHANRNSNTR